MIADHERTEEYLESLENDPRTALNDHINPADHGYVRVEGDFESGFHPGQTDDPRKIFDRLQGQYPRLLFVIDDVGQFDTRFSIWTKEEVHDDESTDESTD